MNENKTDSEITSSINENADSEAEEKLSEVNYWNIEPSKKNKQATTSSVMFQELSHKIAQLSNSDDDHRNRIRQGISLCNELIEIIEKLVIADFIDVQKCLDSLQKVLEEFESSASVTGEKSFVREIFFALLDLLLKSQIRAYLNDDQQISGLNKICYKQVTNIVLKSVAKTVLVVPFTHDDASVREYNDIFCTMYKRVKHDLQNGLVNQLIIGANIDTTDAILVFFGNLAYRTNIVPWLLGIGLIESILQCLEIKRLPSQTIYGIGCIIHNVARHDNGADELRKLNGLTIISEFQVKRKDDFNDETNLDLSIAVALLLTPEQIRSNNQRMNKILNQLLQVTIDAAESQNYMTASGFHVSAPLFVFTKLFVDDHSLEYVISHAETEPQLNTPSTINLFVNLFIEFQDAIIDDDYLKQFTCTALVNILWSISFQDRYNGHLKQNEELLRVLKSMNKDNDEEVDNQYVSRSMERMTKAASGILHNLNRISATKEVVITNTQLVSNVSNEKPMIMISYTRSDTEFCDRILAELDKHSSKFCIWIDRRCITPNEDSWAQIARGIRQSSLVVLLVSKYYHESNSCRTEVFFTKEAGKPIIPVHIGVPGFCDWLDIRIAEFYPVRFEDNISELDLNKVKKLLNRIETMIAQPHIQPQQQQMEHHTIRTEPLTEMKTINSITFDAKKPPEEWTADDIHKWFEKHKVPDTLVKLFDFQSIDEMHEYAMKLRADPKKEFIKYEQRYAKNHGGDELEEYKFNRFKNALLSLTNKQPEPLKASITPEQTSTPKSSACTIL